MLQCQLRLASFREEITLHVEWDGHIVGLDYKSPVGPLASTRDCTKMQVGLSVSFVEGNGIDFLAKVSLFGEVPTAQNSRRRVSFVELSR